MDDLELRGPGLHQALEELVHVNRLLGGYRATMAALRPYLLARRGQSVRILDLGSGLADIPAYVVKWAAEEDVDLHVTAVEGNPAAAAHARSWLTEHLPADLRGRVQVLDEDIWKLQVADKSYDLATAALFLHHLKDEEAEALLQLMNRKARDGIVINDLHRHPLAYHGIRFLGRVSLASSFFRHDGPISVLRGFRKAELQRLASSAGLETVSIRWHWAFRWTLSSVNTCTTQS